MMHFPRKVDTDSTSVKITDVNDGALTLYLFYVI
jgi:hypothetical protein